MPGNLSERTDGRTDRRTDGRTDGHAVKRLWLVRWTNGPMYRSKEGISGFGRTDGRTDGQTDGRTDGQPENIMPPAPKGGGITMPLAHLALPSDQCHITWDHKRPPQHSPPPPGSLSSPDTILPATSILPQWGLWRLNSLQSPDRIASGNCKSETNIAFKMTQSSK